MGCGESMGHLAATLSLDGHLCQCYSARRLTILSRMFAVIKAGGKQYIVREGQDLKVEKLEVEVGKPVEFEVLLVADDEGNTVKVGAPLVSGVSLSATVTEHGRDAKKSVVKFKAKSRYRRHTSHRQPFTQVKIGKI